jgi:regulator of protease activity HflC (stomatin/prohibitin superfamily)
MKKYVLCLIFVTLLTILFGAALPLLFSAKSTEAVLAGFVALAFAGPGLFVLGRHIYRQIPSVETFIKKILPALALLALLPACDNVTAGHVGVKVNKLGSDKGVQLEVVGPGRYWLSWNEEMYLFPTFTVTDTWGYRTGGGLANADQSIRFQTVEGMSVSAEVGITFNFQEKKIAAIFQKYRRGVEEIQDTFLRNIVRDAFVTAASTRPIEVIYGAGKADLIKEVERLSRAEVGEIGIVIENITVVSDFKVPDNVVASINAKIAATQMAQQRQNEVAQAKAEADKRVEEARGEAESIKLRAVAQAEANRILAQSISPTLVTYEAVRRWNGELPRITGEGAIPFINTTLEAK